MFYYSRANILLDDNLTAKLGDYGLVRIQTLRDNSYTNNTTSVHGSRHYMPPEATNGTVTPKWDIYSFGVVSKDNNILIVCVLSCFNCPCIK